MEISFLDHIWYCKKDRNKPQRIKIEIEIKKNLITILFLSAIIKERPLYKDAPKTIIRIVRDI